MRNQNVDVQGVWNRSTVKRFEETEYVQSGFAEMRVILALVFSGALQREWKQLHG